MEIYVITRGIYSDKYIITATEDKELADRILEKYSWDETTKIEVFSNAEEKLLPTWLIKFAGAGVVKVEKVSDERAFDDINAPCVVDMNLLNGGYMDVFVHAPDYFSAVKAAAEHRAKYLAESSGL